jgi:putative acetyltransferase
MGDYMMAFSDKNSEEELEIEFRDTFNKVNKKSEFMDLVKIREYKSSDCKILGNLFYDTVHSVNTKDYSEEEVDAWASKNKDFSKWDSVFNLNYTLIAYIDNKIIGFGDIDKSGYLNMLYIHKDYQGKGIATLICNKLEKGHNEITTDASITAKRFFEKRGYKVIKEQYVKRNSVLLKNYIMKKQIEPNINL